MNPYDEENNSNSNSNNNNHASGGRDEEEEDSKKPAAAAAAAAIPTTPLEIALPRLQESMDDEDDDWSRQVEMDETTAVLHEDSFRLTESVIVEGGGDDEGGGDNNNNNEQQQQEQHHPGTTTAAPPRPRELTLKEKLVMRERERRIETERARLKRQFALSNSHEQDVDQEQGNRPRGHDDDGDDENAADGRDVHHHHHHHDDLAGVTDGQVAASVVARHGTPSRTSESETFGEESIVAHPPDEDEEEEGERRLGFNMERFLRNNNSDSFNPQLEPTFENAPGTIGEREGEEEESTSNVLLKRFLSEPVAMPTSSLLDHGGDNEVAVTRSVSFEGDGLAVVSSAPATRGGGSSSIDEITVPQTTSGQEGEQQSTTNHEGAMSIGEDASASVDAITSVMVEADTDDIARDTLSRIASIETGSDDDVASSSTANAAEEQPRVLRLTEADMQEMAAIEEASIGNAPPSEREEEMLSEIGELADFGGGGGGSHHNMPGNFSLDTPTTAMESASQMSGKSSAMPHSSENDHDHASSEHRSLDGLLAAPTLSSDLMVFSPANDTTAANPPSERAVAHPIEDRDLHDEINDPEHGGIVVEESKLEGAEDVKRSPFPARSVNDESGTSRRSTDDHQAPFVVEGFDFDKHAPTSPLPVDNDDSYRDLPADGWSPTGKMGVSPLHPRRTVTAAQVVGSYGAIGGNNNSGPALPLFPMMPLGAEKGLSSQQRESQPLLSDVPPEIITRRTKSDELPTNTTQVGRNDSMLPIKVKIALEHAFSDVRSEDESETIAINHESEIYLKSSIFARAFPERLFALTVTLLFELPVLLMISGGSDSLCALIGRSRYQLLMAFLPLTSAISGNVGLQASTLTTRAISHNHVTSSSYIPWFKAEIGAAFCLALGMGLVLGSLAFVASGMDFAFGITIMVAQIVSIVTAGLTGTMAPLLFSFIFRQDSGKWGGPLETAIQDIVGSFAMVIISYRILLWVGPGPIDPSDICTIGDADDLG